MKQLSSEIFSLEDINFVAKNLIESLSNYPKIWLFEGEMGVGKTTLITEICKCLGVISSISSPTFNIVNQYDTDNSKVYHIDAYRLSSIDEAENIGLEDYFYEDAFVFIEWPSKITEILPLQFVTLRIEIIDSAKRCLEVYV
jgi:tRNA threonylcarbamoyladenosine biosynthesis protein TsaE